MPNFLALSRAAHARCRTRLPHAKLANFFGQPCTIGSKLRPHPHGHGIFAMRRRLMYIRRRVKHYFSGGCGKSVDNPAVSGRKDAEKRGEVDGVGAPEITARSPRKPGAGRICRACSTRSAWRFLADEYSSGAAFLRWGRTSR